MAFERKNWRYRVVLLVSLIVFWVYVIYALIPKDTGMLPYELSDEAIHRFVEQNCIIEE